MNRTSLLLISLSLACGACKKEAAGPTKPEVVTAPAGAGTVAPDGVRHIDVTAGADGYVPARIPGKPGEKLDLVFTRTVDSECISQLKTPDGKLIDLPKGKPVEVAITVPASGELGFACGMDMFHGAVVAN